MTAVKIKKQNTQKSVLKWILEGYKYCLEATQLEIKINQLENNKFNIGSLEKEDREFIKKAN